MKTVGQLRAELAAYPDDAEVTSAKVVIDLTTTKATLTYSARLARQVERIKEAMA